MILSYCCLFVCLVGFFHRLDAPKLFFEDGIRLSMVANWSQSSISKERNCKVIARSHNKNNFVKAAVSNHCFPW